MIWVKPTCAIKLKSPIGTVHIVAADFNPPSVYENGYLSPIGTAHVKLYAPSRWDSQKTSDRLRPDESGRYNMSRPDGTF